MGGAGQSVLRPYAYSPHSCSLTPVFSHSPRVGGPYACSLRAVTIEGVLVAPYA